MTVGRNHLHLVRLHLEKRAVELEARLFMRDGESHFADHRLQLFQRDRIPDVVTQHPGGNLLPRLEPIGGLTDDEVEGLLRCRRAVRHVPLLLAVPASRPDRPGAVNRGRLD